MSNFGDRLNDVFRDEAYRPMDDDALISVVTHRAGRRRARFHGLFALVAMVVLAGVAALTLRFEPPSDDPAGPTPEPTVNELSLQNVTFDYGDSLAALEALFAPPSCGQPFAPAPATGAGLELTWTGEPRAEGPDMASVETAIVNTAAEPATALVRSGGVIVVRDGVVIQTDADVPYLRVEALDPGAGGQRVDQLVGGPDLCPGASLGDGDVTVYAWAAVSLGPDAGAARYLLESGLFALDELDGGTGGIGMHQEPVPAALEQYCTFGYIDPASDPEALEVVYTPEAPDWSTRMHPTFGPLFDLDCDVPAEALAEYLSVAVPSTYVNDTAAVVLISEPLTISRE